MCSQFYFYPHTINTLRLKESHMSKVLMSLSCIQSQGQASCGKNIFSIEAYKGYFKNLIEYQHGVIMTNRK